MALKTNLIEYWDLSTNSTGQHAGNNGTDTNITYASSEAQFTNAGSSKIVITDAASLKPTGNFSVNAWYKTSNTPGANNAAVFQSYSQNSNVAGIRFGQGGSAKMNILIGKNTGVTVNTDYKELNSATNANSGAFQMWTITYDGSNINLYLDGNSTPDATVANTISPAYAGTNYVRIGCYNFSGTDSDFVDKSLKKIGFWSKALSTAEISTLYNSGNGLLYSEIDQTAVDALMFGHFA